LFISIVIAKYKRAKNKSILNLSVWITATQGNIWKEQKDRRISIRAGGCNYCSWYTYQKKVISLATSKYNANRRKGSAQATDISTIKILVYVLLLLKMAQR